MGTGGRFLRKVRAAATDRPTGFVWIDQEGVAGSGYPASKGQVMWLKQNGVDSVLTLTEEALPSEWLKGVGLDSKHVSMKDHHPPDLGALRAAAEYIRAERAKGRKVAVHCLAGEGRTGCALAAYFILAARVGPGEAISKIRAFKPEFVETNQETAVYRFAEAVGSR